MVRKRRVNMTAGWLIIAVAIVTYVALQIGIVIGHARLMAKVYGVLGRESFETLYIIPEKEQMYAGEMAGGRCITEDGKKILQATLDGRL